MRGIISVIQIISIDNMHRFSPILNRLNYIHREVEILPKHIIDARPMVPVATRLASPIVSNTDLKSFAAITPPGGQPKATSNKIQIGPAMSAFKIILRELLPSVSNSNMPNAIPIKHHILANTMQDEKAPPSMMKSLNCHPGTSLAPVVISKIRNLQRP